MASESRVIVFHITDKGRDLGRLIVGQWPGSLSTRFSAQKVRVEWNRGNQLIFIMATGIVVRTIAPLLESKQADPAVVVLDENGSYAISLTGGHIGGANELARKVAEVVGGKPVITTASDVSGLPAIDLWAQGQNLIVEDMKRVAVAGTKLLNSGSLSVYTEVILDLPDPFQLTRDTELADVLVTDRIDVGAQQGKKLILRPRNLVAGIGCNSKTSPEEIESAVQTVLQDQHLAFLSLATVATVDKKGDEPGLVAFCQRHSLPLRVFTADELNAVPGVTISDAARKAIGANAVAEPSAILALEGKGDLIVPKQKIGNVTVAIARSASPLPFPHKEQQEATEVPNGTLYVVGTGPGNADCLTPRALRAIEKSSAVVGYGTYLDLIADIIADKEVVSTGMAQEIDRCRRAIELARQGKTVSVISGGDPGIFAMAGLVLELLRRDSENGESIPEVEIVPGISALNACAARLGAPLMHDFAAISLSDRLTPWETIETRLDAAAKADFVIVLYNPRSKGRRGHIEKARDIIARHRSAETPVGVVKAAMRPGESFFFSTIGSIPFEEIDMQTTVIVGNSKTAIWNNRMITPRGYEKKKAW
jgi:cobalt-precorrin 5A hydrolase / precorrin-3B C17-methyltransferase